MTKSLATKILRIYLGESSTVLFSSSLFSGRMREKLPPNLEIAYKNLTRSFKENFKEERRLLSIETHEDILLDDKIGAIRKLLILNLDMFNAIEQSSLWIDLQENKPQLDAVRGQLNDAVALLNGSIVTAALEEYNMLEHNFHSFIEPENLAVN